MWEMDTFLSAQMISNAIRSKGSMEQYERGYNDGWKLALEYVASGKLRLVNGEWIFNREV